MPYARQYTRKINRKHSKYLPKQNVYFVEFIQPNKMVTLHVFFYLRMDSFLIVYKIDSPQYL